MKVVISQSMYFPWVGLLEQVRLADIFIHYDDVQYARGFYNRVQVKTTNGIKWLTVPLRDHHRGQKIDEVLIDERTDWRSQHRDILRQAYLRAPYRGEMLELLDEVFSSQVKTLADLSRESILSLSRYFKLTEFAEFLHSSDMNIPGSSSQRLHNICLAVAADIYVTGHGARNYLDHDLFERSGIRVEYMKYQMRPYPQLHGEFTPYVTGLDLVANCGRDGAHFICSESINWKEFINELN
jgi:hypothetical protein